MHNLCHLALTVERHGPLHINSAFMFESFNGTLAKYIHGTKNQGKELVNNVRVAMGVETLRARCLPKPGYSNNPSAIIEFKNRIKGFTLSKTEVQLLLTCHKYKDSVEVFYRALIRREIYTSLLYTRQKRRNNFTICYLNSSQSRVFGEIKYFCKTVHDQMALVHKFNADHLRTFCHDDTQVVIKHIVPILPTGTMEIIDFSAILFKVIRVHNYVCLRPKSLEYNL